MCGYLQNNSLDDQNVLKHLFVIPRLDRGIKVWVEKVF
jgi:hypothetical protein